jgi:hypothetical protein
VPGGHGLGGADRSGAAGDRLQSGQLGPAGGLGQVGEVAGDRVAEVGEGEQLLGLELDQVEDLVVGEGEQLLGLELDQVEDLVVGDVGTGDHVGRTTTAVP